MSCSKGHPCIYIPAGSECQGVVTIEFAVDHKDTFGR
jgi:hypothetical protein